MQASNFEGLRDHPHAQHRSLSFAESRRQISILVSGKCLQGTLLAGNNIWAFSSSDLAFLRIYPMGMIYSFSIFASDTEKVIKAGIEEALTRIKQEH